MPKCFIAVWHVSDIHIAYYIRIRIQFKHIRSPNKRIGSPRAMGWFLLTSRWRRRDAANEAARRSDVTYFIIHRKYTTRTNPAEQN